jgi:hypothetical protein
LLEPKQGGPRPSGAVETAARQIRRVVLSRQADVAKMQQIAILLNCLSIPVCFSVLTKNIC